MKKSRIFNQMLRDYVTDEEMKIVLNIIKNYAENCEVLVFGSRLKGTNKPFSDLDLAFICKEKLDLKKLSRIKLKFEESDLPYRVDIRLQQSLRRIQKNN